VLGEAVERATQFLLVEGHSPGRKVGDNDNRSSHYWFARYWAEAIALQYEDEALKAHFAKIAAELVAQEETILAELKADEGAPADMGGYYHADASKVSGIMRPSATLNGIIG